MNGERKTLYLIERRPRRVRLAPDEIEFLLSHHRAHLDLSPTVQRHVWQVISMGVVGVLHTPRRRISIAPKIPMQTLLYLADAEVTGSDSGQGTDGSAFLDMLAGLLASQMLARARAGLHRAYREESTSGPYLLGALDVPAQLRQAPYRRDQLHGRLDDLTLLLPCNLVPRRLATLLLPLVGPMVRVALEQAISSFTDVPDGPLSADLVAGLSMPGTPGEYAPLLDLCRLLADSVAPSLAAGMTSSPALLVSLERLFERQVTRAVIEVFPDARVQPTHRIGGPPDLVIRPDVVVQREGRTVLIVDAKWRRLPRETLFNEDVYQALAYATIHGCERVVLVYPGRRKTWRHRFSGGTLLEVRTLNVSGTVTECRESVRQLGRELLREG